MLNKSAIKKRIEQHNREALASLDWDFSNALNISHLFYDNSIIEPSDDWDKYLTKKPRCLLQEHTSYITNPMYDLPLYKLYNLHP